MKILSIGLDNSVLDRDSALAQRAVEYGELAGDYQAIALSSKREKIELSEKVRAYGCGGSNKIIRMINLYNLAKRRLRQNLVDVITVQDQYYLALMGLRLAKKYKIGLEIQVHGWEKYHGLRKLVAKYVLPRAGAVRCVSQRLKKILISDFRVPPARITVVPVYGELLPLVRPAADKLSAENKNKFVFLTVGRLVPVKNIGLQIEAMAEVVKRYAQTELWIIGRGKEEDNLKFKINHLKLNNHVRLLGWRDNLTEDYSRADVFVLTSQAEGWGLAVIEAASSGLPIIMTDVGCAGEVIKNGESGVVIPVGDKEKLVEAMMMIIKDKNYREKLGAEARLAVNRLPSKEQTLELYKKSWKMAAADKL